MASPNAEARRLRQGRHPPLRVSPRRNRQSPEYYVPPANSPAPARPDVTSGGTTALAKGGRTPLGVDRDHPARSLSFATPLAVHPKSYTASNSLSSLSNSTSTRRNTTKRLTSPPPEEDSSPPKKIRKSKTGGADDKKEDDKESDYLPVTDAALCKVIEGKGTTWEDNPLSEQHRKAFYLRAFPTNESDKAFHKPQSKSASIAQCRPKTEVDNIINIVMNWEKGKEIRSMQDGEEKNDLLRFRRHHKVGNKYIHQYDVEEIFPPGEYRPRYVLKRMEAPKGKPNAEKVPGRIVLSREELFDAIDEWHHQNGHLGMERTWEYCRAKYWNVTQDHVRHYCMTCYTCMKKNPVTQKIRGSIKPIFSKNFRDRFQVDLVDFRRLRKRDPFGVLMRWVMTIKDHASGLTYVTALPRKQAHLVAYKLQEIFGVLGYPKIFHTDNGKEFTARCVLELLRRLNPNIMSVTGRPRRPRDQGSVENVNKLVKRVLGMVLSERRLMGDNPNWTEVLGSVSSTINSQCGRGKNDITAFEAVYGQKFDFPLDCSKKEARRCWTVGERMRVTNDIDFGIYVKEHYILDDEADSASKNEDVDSGYFSEDDLPLDEMDEVSDEWFDEHLMDDTNVITPTKTGSPFEENIVASSFDVNDEATDSEGTEANRKRPPEDLVMEYNAQRATVNQNSLKENVVPPSDELSDENSHSVEGVNDIVPASDDNGLIFAPSCSAKCFHGINTCHHKHIKVPLNDVGEYVRFHSMWWHRGYCKILSKDKIFFSAQFFCVPRSDDLVPLPDNESSTSPKRSKRNTSSQLKSHEVGCIDESCLRDFSTELFLEWDGNYSAGHFPPAKNFLGKIDRSKNRHIQSNQIASRPKLHNLVLYLEEEMKDITVDSVWIIKKEGQEDGFQEWHQDMKHRIVTTVVMNIGVFISQDEDVKMVKDVLSQKTHAEKSTEQDEAPMPVAKSVLGANSATRTATHKSMKKYGGVMEQCTLQYNTVAKKYYLSMKDGWIVHNKTEHVGENFIYCRLFCMQCSPDLGQLLLVGNDKFIRRYRDSQCWYQYEFICGFLLLVHHCLHMEIPPYKRPDVNVKMVRVMHPNAAIRKSQVVKLDNASHWVSMVYADGHFAVLLFDIKDRKIFVYDGLSTPIKKWTQHISHALRKHGQERHDEKPHERVTIDDNGDDVIELCFESGNNSSWIILKDPVLKQHDWFNCGPIACLKVMELYGFLQQNSIELIRHSQYGYRGVVMQYYCAFLEKYESSIQYPISLTGAKLMGIDLTLVDRGDKKTAAINDQKEQACAEAKKKFRLAKDPDVEEECSDEDEATSEVSSNREAAMRKKNMRQQEQAKKAMKQCGDAMIKRGLAPGTVVTLQVDYRTHYNPEGLIAIVYAVQEGTGGIKAACSDGIITHDGNKGDYWVPADKYAIKAPPDMFLPLPSDLAELRQLVIAGQFIPTKDMQRISYSKLHAKQIGANKTPTKKTKGCNCNKGKCGKKCGCKSKKMSCHSGCSCNGNCG